MASFLSNLETKLDGVFTRSAPPLPEGAKKGVVSILPILSLIVGLLTLYRAYGAWHWAHMVDNAVTGLCNAYSVSGCSAFSAPSRFTVWLWASIILLGVEGLLYLLAFPGLRDRKKEGWNYLFYGTLLNLVYGVAVLFSGFDGATSFLGAVISSAIGFYFLFQVRSMYASKKAAAAASKNDSEKK